MRPLLFDIAMIGVAIASLFALIPAIKPRTKVTAGLAFVVATSLTAANFYLRSYTGLGLEDRVICYALPHGPACARDFAEQAPPLTSVPPQQRAPVGPAVDPLQIELSYWQSIMNSNNPDLFREYLRRYPNGQFASIARQRIKDLTAVAAPPDTQASPSRPPSQPSVQSRWLLSRVIDVETIDATDQTREQFPESYLMQRLVEELGPAESSIAHVRMGVAFIEPRELRPQASGGSIIGFLVVSLPSLPGCVRSFGTSQLYRLQTPQLGIMKAIGDHASDIASWLKLATQGELLTCPGR